MGTKSVCRSVSGVGGGGVGFVCILPILLLRWEPVYSSAVPGVCSQPCSSLHPASLLHQGKHVRVPSGLPGPGQGSSGQGLG